MYDPCWFDVGDAGMNVRSAGLKLMTASNPLNPEPGSVTQSSSVNSASVATFCVAGKSATCTPCAFTRGGPAAENAASSPSAIHVVRNVIIYRLSAEGTLNDR